MPWNLLSRQPLQNRWPACVHACERACVCVCVCVCVRMCVFVGVGVGACVWVCACVRVGVCRQALLVVGLQARAGQGRAGRSLQGVVGPQHHCKASVEPHGSVTHRQCRAGSVEQACRQAVSSRLCQPHSGSTGQHSLQGVVIGSWAVFLHMRHLNSFSAFSCWLSCCLSLRPCGSCVVAGAALQAVAHTRHPIAPPWLAQLLPQPAAVRVVRRVAARQWLVLPARCCPHARRRSTSPWLAQLLPQLVRPLVTLAECGSPWSLAGRSTKCSTRSKAAHFLVGSVVRPGPLMSRLAGGGLAHPQRCWSGRKPLRAWIGRY